MNEEHPFAQYIRILGKGKRGSRGLTQQEAYDSMTMVLEGKVEECQLGAYLMLLRVKEETPEEIAGFVSAIKDTFSTLKDSPTVALDWSSYAGKRRHLPWFLLSALMLAENDITVFMHGAEGHTAGRIYTRDILSQLGLPESKSMEQAADEIRKNNFAYLPLEYMSPIMHRIIQMRPLLGLRSPVHTIARMLNPFNADYEIQGIFHPTYRETHQEAAQLINQPHLAVFIGEGGEIDKLVNNIVGKFPEIEDDITQLLVTRGIIKKESTKLLWIPVSDRMGNANYAFEQEIRDSLHKIVFKGAKPGPAWVVLMSIIHFKRHEYFFLCKNSHIITVSFLNDLAQ